MLLRACLMLFFSGLFLLGLSGQSVKNHAELLKATDMAYMDGDYELAAQYMWEAREKALAKSENIDTCYAIYTHRLALYLYLQGQYAKSEPLHLEGLGVYKKLLGEKHKYYAEALNGLGLLYAATGREEKAEELYLKAIEIQRSDRAQRSLYASTLTNLAVLYSSTGRFSQAEQLYLEVISIDGESTEAERSATLNNLAFLYFEMKEYDKSIAFMQKVLDIDAKIYGLNNPNYAISLQNMATIYTETGRHKEALSLYLQALAIDKVSLGENSLDYANSLSHLAFLYFHMKQYDKAEQLYLSSTKITVDNLGTECAEYANLMKYMSNLYYHIGDIQAAHKYAKAALAANSADIDAGFSDWTSVAKYSYYNNKITNQIIDNVLNIFSLEYQKTGDKNKLQASYELAQAAILYNQRLRNDFTVEEDKLHVLANNNDFVLAGIDVAFTLNNRESWAQAFVFAELNKAVLLLDAAKSEKAYQFGELPDSIAQKEKNLQQKYTALQAELLENRPKSEKDSLRRIMNDLSQEVRTFTQAIKSEYPKYAAIKYEQKNTSVADIQAAMPPKTALLEYVISDSCTYLFYISAQEFRLLRLPFLEQELKKNIKILHNSLSNYINIKDNPEAAYKEYTETAHWFYKNLLAPAAINPAEIEQLIIIPDGEIGHLPFEAFLVLPAPEGEQNYVDLHYLLRDFAVSYNYSAALWLENIQTKKPVNNGQVFAMAADYSLKIDSSKAHFRLPSHQRLRKILRPLPAARNEIAQMATFLDGYFATDTLACEADFKQNASKYSIVHLAMHGLLDNQNQLLSCLAFSEDGDSSENNFLQVYEISQMQLNADLVVLSACETGYGRFQKGNGLASLARAFMYAGSPALLVSLWEVNDLTTSILMPNFYENIALGANKAEALRQTKLNYIRKSQGIAAHPAFWSAFVQIGDTRPIDIAQKNVWRTYKYVIFGAIGLVFLLFLGLFLRKKNKASLREG